MQVGGAPRLWVAGRPMPKAGPCLRGMCGVRLSRRGGRAGPEGRWLGRIQAVASPTKESEKKAVDQGAEAPMLAEGRPVVLAAASESPDLPQSTSGAFNVAYKRVLRELSSFPRAIGVLAIIGFCCAVGTVIEQNKPVAWYLENYPNTGPKMLGFLTSDWLYFLQWDHIYTCWYFLLLMALLASQLVACTYTRQFPVAKVAQRWQFASSPEAVAKKGNHAETLPDARVTDLGGLLNDKGYQVCLKDSSLYAFKGLAGRFAPIGVHLAMLFVMGGVVYGAFGGFKGSAMVPQGGEFVMADALTPNSFISSLPDAAQNTLRVHDFSIDYRPDGSIAQFYSDLSIEDRDGRELKRKTISVNDPFRFGGLTMYQTDWSMAAISVKAMGSPLQPDNGEFIKLPMASLEGRKDVSGRVWATFIPMPEEESKGGQPQGVSVLAKDFQTVVLYDSNGQFAGVRRPGSGKVITVDGMDITIGDILGSTGLEMKVDPGVPLVYAGFAGLMLTSLLSYLSHSQVWAFQQGRDLHVSGKTNRAKVAFELELSELLDRVPDVAPPPEATTN